MKKLTCCRTCITHFLSKICLIDKCLMILMTILMMQSIYSLFFHLPSTPAAEQIDVILRTTTAGIFGYFISANFIKKGQDSLSRSALRSDEAADDPMLLPNTTENNDAFSGYEASRQQVIIAATIGTISLLALILARNCLPLSHGSTAVTVQFRDFVSGCIGFLLGHPKRSS